MRVIQGTNFVFDRDAIVTSLVRWAPLNQTMTRVGCRRCQQTLLEANHTDGAAARFEVVGFGRRRAAELSPIPARSVDSIEPRCGTDGPCGCPHPTRPITPNAVTRRK